MVRVDHSALLRGYPIDGEVCDIPGFGTTTVEAVRDMIATGDPVLKAIVTNSKRCWASCTCEDAPTPTRKVPLTGSFPHVQPMAVARGRVPWRQTTAKTGLARTSRCTSSSTGSAATTTG